MSALIIGPEQEARIREVIAYAQATRLSAKEMEKLGAKLAKKGNIQEEIDEMGLPKPGQAVGDDPGHRCELPFGFRCVFSIEEHPAPLNWVRHLSVSVARPGMLPHPEAMNMISKAFGFRHPIPSRGKHLIFIEGGRAINVIEPLEDITLA